MTPIRLLGLAGIALIAATGWWLIYQQQLAAARRTWRQEMDAVSQVLKDGQDTSIRSSLEKAVAAASLLGRTDADARRANSLLRQTLAVEQLSSLDLVSQLQEAGRGAQNTPDSANNAALAPVERVPAVEQQWYVFDCPLSAGSGDPHTVIAELLLIVDGVPVTVETQSELLRQLAELRPNQPAIFAAQVQKGQRSAGEQPEWRITLVDDSCCLITTEYHARAIGYDVPTIPELPAMLERQAEFVEQRPAESPTAEQGTQATASASERGKEPRS